MQKSEVVEYFGTQEKVREFIHQKTGKMYAHTTISMWPDTISPKWALFFDKHTDLIFRKGDYQ